MFLFVLFLTNIKMAEKIYLYPKWIRFWHLLNALCCLILIISGFSLQYAAPGHMFLPLNLTVKMHNLSGIVFSLNYLIFIIGNFLTPNGKFYSLNDRPFLQALAKQFHYYTIGIFHYHKQPFPVTKERKFNPLQKISYFITMYVLVPIVILSGTVMLNPILIEQGRVFLVIDLIHIVAGFIISLFFLIHLYFTTIGFKTNYQEIITGWHENNNYPINKIL